MLWQQQRQPAKELVPIHPVQLLHDLDVCKQPLLGNLDYWQPAKPVRPDRCNLDPGVRSPRRCNLGIGLRSRHNVRIATRRRSCHGACPPHRVEREVDVEQGTASRNAARAEKRLRFYNGYGINQYRRWVGGSGLCYGRSSVNVVSETMCSRTHGTLVLV